MTKHFCAWASVLVLVLLARPVAAGETCYMVVLSSQRPEANLPRYSHSFAAFVRVNECRGVSWLESFTISWLPVRGAVQFIALLPEPGRNFGLHETIRLVQAECERVSLWGPYQITPELYRRALQQKAHLESGAVSYKAVDTGWPAARVSNCIHAVADIAADEPPLRIASPGWGDPASYYIVLHLLPEIINPRMEHDWVLDVLGLRDCSLLRRHLSEGNPSTSAAVRVLMAAAQPRLQRRQRCLYP
jgi:hypothetical protein